MYICAVINLSVSKGYKQKSNQRFRLKAFMRAGPLSMRSKADGHRFGIFVCLIIMILWYGAGKTFTYFELFLHRYRLNDIPVQ